MINKQYSGCQARKKISFFRASNEDFKKIPGCSIAYWLSPAAADAFVNFDSFSEAATACQGLATTDNNRFVRAWHEVAFSRIGLGFATVNDAKETGLKWFPLDKGGQFRKWFGNNDFVVNWENDGLEIRANIVRKYPYLKGNPDFVAKNPSKYFRAGVTWGKVTMGAFSARYSPQGAIFSDAGMKAFCEGGEIFSIAGLFNSKVTPIFLGALSETINYEQGNIARLPYKAVSAPPVSALIDLAKNDWNSSENSWDFSFLPLLSSDQRLSTIQSIYNKLRANWRKMTMEMQRLEEENNRIFIDAYGLQDELDEKVDLSEITLTCNPYYRYGGNKSEEELEALLLADTMRELVSYAVGCMFGRYSLDKPGLILANQGETLADYLAQVPAPSFPADDDNVIPLLGGDWFTDDVTLRFRQFLRVAFGEAHYDDNLAFIEQALNVKGKRNYGLRDYFLGEFYTDHVKRYKKRPIYWLFSSPRGSFNALVYMHRYRPDTVSVVLRYLREFRAKLLTEKERQASVSINPGSSQGEKTKALKEVDRLAKVLAELEDYERDTLYPLATEQKQIDLDDGVKVNYLKFGAALKNITGLETKDED